MKLAARPLVYAGMTETLQDRLRHGAANIHSIGPDRAAGLLKEAAEQAAKYDVLVTSIEALRDMVLKEHAAAEQAEAAHRAFLERAVCHPGPPASEHEDYDPEADLGELEAAVLERMDLELEAERELRDIRKLCEEALGRTPDPARSTVQVVRDLLAQPTTMQRLNERCRERRVAERATADLVPIVRREHFAGPFPAISGYIKRTEAARAATVDQALRMLKDGQRLAVHDEPERVDILFLDPGQEPPLGQEWTVYGPQRGPWLTPGSIRVAGGNPETIAALGLGEAASAPHPKAAEFQKLVDGLRDRHPKLETYRPGSPTPERAPADYHPAEYTTPEQGTELEERLARFDHDWD